MRANRTESLCEEKLKIERVFERTLRKLPRGALVMKTKSPREPLRGLQRSSGRPPRSRIFILETLGPLVPKETQNARGTSLPMNFKQISATVKRGFWKRGNCVTFAFLALTFLSSCYLWQLFGHLCSSLMPETDPCCTTQGSKNPAPLNPSKWPPQCGNLRNIFGKIRKLFSC